MNWIIKELQWKAGVLKETGVLSVFDVGVLRSDTAVSKDVQEALKEAVKPFENASEDQKDYHPGSDNKVVDLVHPSLFPVVYGRTRVLADKVIGLDDCLSYVGQGDLVPIPSPETCGHLEQGRRPFSDKFQWLPCDVDLLDNGDCRIVSYINNAHPVRHKGLYEVVEKIISRAMPLWEKSLSQNKNVRIEYSKVEYGEHPEPEPEQSEDEDEDDFWDRHQAWRDSRPIILPEPGKFEVPEEWEKLNMREHFPNTKMQVIVKLANIELTPETPSYDGGSWHIEGQLVRITCFSIGFEYLGILTVVRMSVSVLPQSTTMIAKISPRTA